MSTELKALILLIAIIAAAALGVDYGMDMREAQMTKMRTAYNTALGKSEAAKLAAEARATEIEAASNGAVMSAVTSYEESRKNEKALDDRRIADLSGRVASLLVSTSHRPASGGALPAAGACAASGDGQATETLAPAVAARLARRYADYNELVDQLGLCQTVVAIDRQQ